MFLVGTRSLQIRSLERLSLRQKACLLIAARAPLLRCLVSASPTEPGEHPDNDVAAGAESWRSASPEMNRARTIPYFASPLSRYWSTAQRLGIVLTVVLLGGLVQWPTASLHVLWDMVIPLLPAVFLVNPMLWRNVCPLATLNSMTGVRIGTRELEGRAARVAWGAGIVLLLVMVPARRFLFNTNGVALSATIVGVALLALIGGVVFSRRGGFCNAICPVLPVEKLYGQAPLLSVGNPRCADCSLCTPVGCIDLAATKAVAQTIGPARRDRRWLATPFGIFAAAFPGFIIAFFATDNGPLSTAAAVYTRVVLYSAVSYAFVALLARIARVSAAILLPALGGTAFILYYWFSAPTLGQAYGAPQVGPIIVRMAAAVLLSIWLLRARPFRRLAER